MITYLGDFDTTETVHIPFNTFSSDDPSASVTITNLAAGDVEIHKDGSVTQRASDSGVTVSVDFDSITGNHMVHIDLSDNADAGFYATGSRYQVRIEGTTVDGGTLNVWIGTFSVGCILRPTTDGRTLDVTATGAAGIDWANVENPTTAVDLSATAIDLCDEVTTNSDMRGTDDAALASVVGALADAAAAGEVTEADTLMQYIKQLINILIGAAGIAAFPAEAAPGNAVSLAEVIRAIHADVTGLNGAAMRGTDGANTTVPDAAGTLASYDPPTKAEMDAAHALLATPSQVNTECDNAIETYKLDHLIAAAESDDPVDNSIIAKLAASDGDWTGFSAASDSLQAIRDRGDAAWTTGGGGSISDILNIQVLIPNDIDLANTVSVRVGLGLTNMLDDLPSTAEITPGTITIDRKAIGGTSWSNIVNAAACSELTGLIYYDEVFDSGTGYAEGDSIRITFKSQKITVAANDYEITGTDGWIFQTSIRQTMRGTDSAALASICTEGRLAELDAANIPADLSAIAAYIDTEVAAIKAVTDNLPNSGALTDLATAAALATADTVVDAIKAVTDNLPNSGALTDLATAAALATVDSIVDAIKAKTDNLPSGVAKNVALSNFDFLMVDSTDHLTPKTGLTITEEISKDGGAFAACSNAAAEVGSGIYKISLTQAEMNADVITLKFTASGADQRTITILTAA